ncbi:MAG TPA: serine hydrolase domain-containing protein [Longimicrobium sp.]|nr:serine hydrolase domain-containing protein [Longimicrobium sp.]
MRPRLFLSLLPILLIATAAPARAQAQAEPLPGLEALMDSVIGIEIREYGVPGIVVTVVHEGRIVFSKGYGMADQATRRPVVPESTVFRVGSVAKPLTATAVLQLAARGRIDLDAPVERYVGRGMLRGRYARQVRVRHLLTHTGGLDVRLTGTAAATADGMLPLAEYLRRDLPPVIHRPGRVTRYSNHGYALLGLVVERASGMPFERYMRDHVFRPVGMTSSGYRLEGDALRRAAVGYEPRRGGPVRAVVMHPHVSPAAGLNTTAADMGRWMIAQLEAPASPQLVPRLRMDDAMPGWAYGLYETWENGRRGFGHSGGIRGFMSGVYLWPRERTGLFVSDNGYDGEVVRVVFRAFADRYLPAPPAPPPPARYVPAPGAAARARELAGSYRMASAARGNLERAGVLRAGDVSVTAHPDGTITLFRMRLRETSPLHYRQAEGEEIVAFVRDRRGRVRWLLQTDPFGGNVAWERVAWWQAASLHQALLYVFVLAFLAAPFLGPRGGTGGVLRQSVAGAWSARARRLRKFVSALNLLFLVLLFLGFRASRATGMLLGPPPLVRIALALGVAAALLAVIALPWSGWKLRQEKGPAEIAVHAAFTVIALGFVAYLAYWNLLGWKF